MILNVFYKNINKKSPPVKTGGLYIID